MLRTAVTTKTLFTSKLKLNLRKELVKCSFGALHLWCWNFGTAGTRSEILGRVWEKDEEDQWTGRVLIEEVLSGVKEEKSVVHTIKWRTAKWISNILRRNCLLEHVIEGKIEGTVRRGRRCKQLLGHYKGTRGSTRSHCQENRFGRSNGPDCKTDYIWWYWWWWWWWWWWERGGGEKDCKSSRANR